MLEHQIHFPDSDKIGCFRILFETLRDCRAQVQALFNLCTVVHVEDDETGRGKMYYAASDLFEQIKEGSEIPEYRIESREGLNKFDQSEHEARAISSTNSFRFVAIKKIIVRVPTLQIGHKAHSTRQ